MRLNCLAPFGRGGRSRSPSPPRNAPSRDDWAKADLSMNPESNLNPFCAFPTPQASSLLRFRMPAAAPADSTPSPHSRWPPRPGTPRTEYPDVLPQAPGSRIGTLSRVRFAPGSATWEPQHGAGRHEASPLSGAITDSPQIWNDSPPPGFGREPLPALRPGSPFEPMPWLGSISSAACAPTATSSPAAAPAKLGWGPDELGSPADGMKCSKGTDSDVDIEAAAAVAGAFDDERECFVCWKTEEERGMPLKPLPSILCAKPAKPLVCSLCVERHVSARLAASSPTGPVKCLCGCQTDWSPAALRILCPAAAAKVAAAADSAAVVFPVRFRALRGSYGGGSSSVGNTFSADGGVRLRRVAAGPIAVDAALANILDDFRREHVDAPSDTATSFAAPPPVNGGGSGHQPWARSPHSSSHHGIAHETNATSGTGISNYADNLGTTPRRTFGRSHSRRASESSGRAGLHCPRCAMPAVVAPPPVSPGVSGRPDSGAAGHACRACGFFVHHRPPLGHSPLAEAVTRDRWSSDGGRGYEVRGTNGLPQRALTSISVDSSFEELIS